MISMKQKTCLDAYSIMPSHRGLVVSSCPTPFPHVATASRGCLCVVSPLVSPSVMLIDHFRDVFICSSLEGVKGVVRKEGKEKLRSHCQIRGLTERLCVRFKKGRQ